MITIGIVRSTGSLQGDQVLRGVYGKFTPGEIDGGVGKFEVAPEFKRISHLFGLLDGGQSPVTPQSLYTLEVDESQEHLAKAQLMHAMATRWEKMYARVAPGQVGMLSVMLTAESRNVSTAAKHHLVSMGMRAYLVPVTCEMVTGVPGEDMRTERDLISSLQCPTNLQLADGEAVDLGTDLLVAHLQQPARDMAPATATDAPAPAWAESTYGNGVAAKVAGSIVVIAPTAEAARDAATLTLRMGAAADATGVSIEFMPESILEARPLPAQSYDDFDDSGFDPDFDDRPRGG